MEHLRLNVNGELNLADASEGTPTRPLRRTPPGGRPGRLLVDIVVRCADFRAGVPLAPETAYSASTFASTDASGVSTAATAGTMGPVRLPPVSLRRAR